MSSPEKSERFRATIEATLREVATGRILILVKAAGFRDKHLPAIDLFSQLPQYTEEILMERLP
jgi:hypothetical protein